ncbi:FAD-dependent oxidoreductase [Aeromonas jandaei]
MTGLFDKGVDMLYAKEISTAERHYDLIVVGGGSAGASAAILAARNGLKTLLVEKMPFVGGTSTAVLDTFYGYYSPGGKSKKIIGGVPDDVAAKLIKYNSYLERPNTHGAGTAVSYNPEYLKVVWEELLCEAGANVLLNAQVVDVIADRDRRIEGIVVTTKTGLKHYTARFYIDASGDADICYYAGFPYEQAGEFEPAQTLTTTFKMGNVDIKKRFSINKQEVFNLMEAAGESGLYNLPRREGSDHITTVENVTATIMTRLISHYVDKNGKHINATDPDILSSAEIEGRKQALEYVRFLKDKVPGYENSQLISFGYQIGVRETRRIYGEYRLTKEDVLSAKKFHDQIGVCGAPIEDHHSGKGTKWIYLPDGEVCGIPFRVLVPQGSKNLLVAGRCLSATHDAHASVRSMGQTMSMGQAAGLAVCLAVENDLNNIMEIDIETLRQRLTNIGAIV